MGNETGHPVRGAGKSIPQDDDYERHMAEERARFLRGVAEDVTRVAAERGWHELAVCGDSRLADVLESRLNAGCTLVRVDKDLAAATAQELSDRVTPILRDLREQHRSELVEQARDGALAPGGHGALGLRATLAALTEGRVRCLIVDPAAELRLARAADGVLVDPGDLPEGVTVFGLETIDDPLEQLVRSAIDTAAAVTFLARETPSAAVLAGHGGVAALLRW